MATTDTTPGKKPLRTTLTLLRLLGVLREAGAKYRITMPNGAEFASGASAKNGGKRTKTPDRDYGEVRAYYAPLLKALADDTIINVPCGKYPARELAGNISAYLSKRLGIGNASVSGPENAKTVDVYIIKGDAEKEA